MAVKPGTLLMSQLRWFISLRWIAGATVLLFALVDGAFLRWYGHAGAMAALGAAILLCNAWLRLATLGGESALRIPLLAIAAAQIVVDLCALVLLTLWTGGIASPLMGFYVLHMIFASLMLPRRMAYAGVVVAIGLALAGFQFSGELVRWTSDQWRLLAGWTASLALAVYLANHITRALRRQRRKLVRQNRHIRRIGRRLRGHQELMMRQEKMAAMGHMAAGITHEIANPLASMDALLQLLQRRPEKISAESIQTLRQQVGRVNEIVRQMTDFAHPGEGSWQVAPINDVVPMALDMLRYDTRMARVKVILHLDPTTGSARMMMQSIAQVIINLVVNALDAMERTAEPQLTLRTRRAGTWCVIEVSDNGEGIPQARLSRIFEPFFTTKPVGKGTGVGLSISYTLVARHSGRIEVRSRVGEGTTFEIRLPAEPPAADSPAKGAQA